MKKYYIADPLDTRWNEINFKNEFSFEGKTYVSSEENIDFVKPVEIPKGYLDELERIKELEKSELEIFKEERIKSLNENINKFYKAYLERYPEVEIRSFEEKAKESFLVKKDSQTPLEDTPLLCALVGKDKSKRDELARQVYQKVEENTKLEAWGVITRDKIKTAQTKEAVLEIDIEVPRG